jgi:hypothetical protein
MAKKTETIVTVTDDLDGSKAATTVSFAWKGIAYEVDLSKKNASAFQQAVAPYVANARKLAGTRGPRRRKAVASGRATSGRQQVQAIRAWAKANGHKVSERGRIAQSIQDAYRAAK